MKQLLLFTLSLLLLGCTAQDEVQLSQRLHQLMDDYVEDYYQLNPVTATYLGDNRFNDRLSLDVSESYRQKARDVYSRYMELLGGRSTRMIWTNGTSSTTRSLPKSSRGVSTISVLTTTCFR
ncbi:MAG: hypothetical protein WBG01_17540 [Bacteroidota bacterium]